MKTIYTVLYASVGGGLVEWVTFARCGGEARDMFRWQHEEEIVSVVAA